MSDNPSRPSVALTLAREVDRVCDRFEAAWAAGGPPRVEDFLAGVTGPHRDVLLLELLRLDAHYRRAAGETPTPADYAARFPGLHADWVSAALTRPTAVPDPPPPPGMPALPPGYELLGELGRGGMGVVYKARQASLNRVVALKMILAGGHAGPEELSRFYHEAASVAELHHPNVVQVYEVGEHEGRPFFTLEYVEGGSLSRHARDPLPPRVAAGLVEQVARGVAHAHARGVVHRDLKPDNILLQSDERGTMNDESKPKPKPGFHSSFITHPSSFRPKVTDFGLAKRLAGGTDLTATGAVLGTPSYMAPEQAEGRKDVGPAADIYGLGAVLYRLLTGRAPFAAATPHETLYLVMATDPPAPSELVPGIPRDLQTICLKCLRKDPARRYAAADELADDLRRYLDGRPITARPVGSAERAWKWARRHRGPTASAVTVFLALAVGGGVAVWKAAEARDQAARAGAKEREANDQAAEAKKQAAIADANRREANDQAAEAKKQLATATAVKGYLQRVFTQATAKGQAGRPVDPNLSVKEAMANAAADLAGKFPDQPLIEAELRLTIAKAFYDLGAAPQAREQFQKAADLWTAARGPDHPETLECLEGLGLLHLKRDELDDAERLIARVLAGREKSLGPDHEDTIGAVHNMAAVHSYRERNAEAIALYARALAAREKLLGRNSRDTLITLANLAGAYQSAGNDVKAEELFAKSLAGYEVAFGPDDPETLIVAGNLADVYADRGDFTRAVPLAERVLAGRDRVLGPDHEDSLTAAHNLAAMYQPLKEYARAAPLYRRAWVGRQRLLGPAHGRTLVSANGLATVYELLGEWAKAEPPLRMLLAYREKEKSWFTGNARSRVGGSLLGQGRLAEAEPPLLEAFRELKERAATIPVSHRAVRLQEAAGRLATLYAALGKPADAAKWRAEAKRYPEPAPPPRPAK